MKFPYKRYTVASSSGAGDEELHRPMLPLRVIGPAGDAFLWALRDTGADETILPRSIGESIGLGFENRPAWSIGGIGGQTIEVHAGDVTLQVSDGMQTVEWDATVGFADFADPKDEAVILGHAGCLDFFRASFDGELREVELVATSEFPGHVK